MLGHTLTAATEQPTDRSSIANAHLYHDLRYKRCIRIILCIITAVFI